jgi:hypothetical protein
MQPLAYDNGHVEVAAAGLVAPERIRAARVHADELVAEDGTQARTDLLEVRPLGVHDRHP